jgi:hypothetical protein
MARNGGWKKTTQVIGIKSRRGRNRRERWWRGHNPTLLEGLQIHLTSISPVFIFFKSSGAVACQYQTSSGIHRQISSSR